jgi:hypothetical protein
MRSRRCSGSGRPSGDTGMSGRRVISKTPSGPTWKEGQTAPRRRPQPFSRILTAWKGLYSITYAERLAYHCPPGAHWGVKGLQDAQNTPEDSQKRAKIDVPERDNAK